MNLGLAINSANIRWHVSDGYQTSVAGDTAPDWFGLADDPRAELVKRNPLRQVYRVTLAQGAYFAKVFRHEHLAGRLKRWVFGPPAVVEFQLARALDAVGVGAIRAVAAGVSSTGHRSVLISEEFDGALALSELWNQSDFEPAPLIECVAAFLAKTHQADVLPRDTHAGNLLLRRASVRGGWEVVHADLAGTRVGQPVTEQEAARNIAELYQWFRSRTRATQRARFLRVYLRERSGDNRNSRRRFSRLIEITAAAGQRKLWAKRDRRILGTNAYFGGIDLGDNWAAHFMLRCRAGNHTPTHFESERTPDQWQQWLDRHLPDVGTEPPDTLPDDLHLDRRRAGAWQGWWWRLVGSPLRRRFVVGHALRHRDLPALCLPALFERTSAGVVWESALLAHRPRTTEPLNNAVQRLAEDDSGLRRYLFTAIGRLLADMVQRGVGARRLTPDMFAVVGGTGTDRLILCITDFDGLTVHRQPVFAAVVWMPVCLVRCCPRGVTRTDRLRFLLAYWRRLPRQLRPGGWKTLWKQIETLTED